MCCHAADVYPIDCGSCNARIDVTVTVNLVNSAVSLQRFPMKLLVPITILVRQLTFLIISQQSDLIWFLILFVVTRS